MPSTETVKENENNVVSKLNKEMDKINTIDPIDHAPNLDSDKIEDSVMQQSIIGNKLNSNAGGSNDNDMDDVDIEGS